ncbi:MAG: hypothetical protein J6A27_07190 [Bacteroidales bacterium]|nr:hypothetical protein [Bacteroidales bacterium]
MVSVIPTRDTLYGFMDVLLQMSYSSGISEKSENLISSSIGTIGVERSQKRLSNVIPDISLYVILGSLE